MAPGSGLRPGLDLRLRIAALHHAGAPGPLFKAFDLDVAAGEVVALIGPSGVGKTTLLRLAGGLETRFAGEVRIAGLAPDKAPPPGMVFQDARLLPWLDAAANLRLVRPGLSDPEVDRLLGQVGLTGQGAAYPHHLSGGMQQRLALARALAVEAGLWLLDEPFAGLDPALAESLREVLAALVAQSGATVLLASHDPLDAARLADRAVFLAGRPARIAAELRLPPDTAEAEALIRAEAARQR